MEANKTGEESGKGKTYYFLVSFTASAIAASLSKTVTAPLERVKLIQQTGTIHEEYPATRSLSVFKILKYIKNKQGILSLWRGNVLTIIRAVPSQALVFGFQDFYRRLLPWNPEMSRNENTSYSLLSGAMSAGTVILITYPIYFCQNIISSHVGPLEKAKFSGIKGCIGKTKDQSGFSGLYRGFHATAVSVMINRALYFGLYDFFKETYIRSGSTKISRWTSAQAATLIAAITSYPIETIGRLMIIDAYKDSGARKPLHLYVRDISRNGGYRVFFGGFYANVLRSVGGALVLIIHEDISSLMFWIFGE